MDASKWTKKSVLSLYNVIFNINVGFGAVIMACATIYHVTYRLKCLKQMNAITYVQSCRHSLVTCNCSVTSFISSRPCLNQYACFPISLSTNLYIGVPYAVSLCLFFHSTVIWCLLRCSSIVRFEWYKDSEVTVFLFPWPLPTASLLVLFFRTTISFTGEHWPNALNEWMINEGMHNCLNGRMNVLNEWVNN